MKPLKIYIVEGSTGEYSDCIVWKVKAFTSEKKAKQLVKLCSQEARIYYQKNQNNIPPQLPAGANKYDPDMLMYYTCTTYSYDEVELEMDDL